MSNRNFTAVVGAQFGSLSEGKGLIVGHLAKDYDVHVRVGAANAGHTIYTDKYGASLEADPGATAIGREKHVMQQIPCAAYANPSATLVIGPGAVISMDVFIDEFVRLSEWCQANGVRRPAIHVDHRAHVIQQEQIDDEQTTGLAERIGSTSTIAREGIGTAAADRLLRAERCVTVAQDAILNRDRWEQLAGGVQIDDTSELLAEHRGPVLLEGTQGTGLSNVTGYFPYVTSRCTTSAGLAADCGAAPNRIGKVILVARTYPIRVAGNSGPFHPSSQEISWQSINIDPENERTTVTKKVRRVATFSVPQIAESARINGATEIALTFADYLSPRIAGLSGPMPYQKILDYKRVTALVDAIEQATGVPVKYLGTGPHSVIELV